jgi:archaellum component FlaF (FlaF/FlaG flagellin family)
MKKLKEAMPMIMFILLCFGALTVAIFGAIADRQKADALYNNGVCPRCNTEFHLVNAQHLRNCGTHYFYVCENGHIIECPCQPQVTTTE